MLVDFDTEDSWQNRVSATDAAVAATICHLKFFDKISFTLCVHLSFMSQPSRNNIDVYSR